MAVYNQPLGPIAKSDPPTDESLLEAVVSRTFYRNVRSRILRHIVFPKWTLAYTGPESSLFTI